MQREQREQDRITQTEGARMLQEMNKRELWKGWILLTLPILRFHGGKYKKKMKVVDRQPKCCVPALRSRDSERQTG